MAWLFYGLPFILVDLSRLTQQQQIAVAFLLAPGGWQPHFDFLLCPLRKCVAWATMMENKKEVSEKIPVVGPNKMMDPEYISKHVMCCLEGFVQSLNI